MHLTKLRMATPLLLATGAPALAQVGGEATWLWDVTTQDGDAIVEPGETATVTLSIDMTPDVNVPDGPVLGLSVTVFDTIGRQNAKNGYIGDWQILNTLDDLTGDVTELHGVNLIGTTAAQSLNGDDPFSHDDPIAVLQFRWETDDYSEYSVSYATETYFIDPGREHQITVWEGDLNDEFDAYVWPIAEAEIQFVVVPGPSPIVLIVPALLGVSAKRRRPGH